MSEEYLVKTAKTIKEARKLVKEGFKYVCEMKMSRFSENAKSGCKSEGGLLRSAGGGI